MRALRVLLAALLAYAPAQAGTVDVLYERSYIPVDAAAAALPEDGALRSGERLAKLQAELTLGVEGLEGFASDADAEPSLARLRASVEGPARDQFTDRAAALNAAYRALAATDYTWAKRLPDAPCSPDTARARLLRSDSLSSWLSSLLGVKIGAAAALDQASAGNVPSARDYALLRARVRRIGEALASDKATGSSRAALYCRRAQAYESLSSANQANALTSASLKADTPSTEGVLVLARRVPDGLQILGAATAVEGKLVTDERLIRGDELLALRRGGEPISVHVVRRGGGLALLEGVPTRGYALADAAPVKDDLVIGIGHVERTGAWTETRGLVTASGPDSFQTDAVVDEGMAGGAALTEDGKLAGVFVLRPVRSADETFDWPVAVSAPALKAWLAGGELKDYARGELAEAGSSSVLTASRGLAESLTPGAGAVEAGTRWTEGGGGYGTIHGSCPTCPDGSGGGSPGGSGYDTSAAGELGKVMGQAMAQMIFKGVPALFRGIGSLFKSKPGSTTAKVRSQPAVRQDAPTPPPLPDPKLSMTLVASKERIGPGETGEFVARVTSNRTDIPVSGHQITFKSVDAEGRTQEEIAWTDASGEARLSVYFPPSVAAHKDLDDESAKHPWLTNASSTKRAACKITVMTMGAIAVTASLAPAAPAALAGGTAALAASATPLPVTTCAAIGAGLATLANGVCNMILGDEQARAAEPRPSRESTEARPPARTGDHKSKQTAAKESVEAHAWEAQGELSRTAEEKATQKDASDDSAVGQPADPGEEPPDDSADDIRKPSADNPELKRAIGRLFQSTDRYPGGTAGAVRYERSTGKLLSPAGHAKKGREVVRWLEKILKKQNLTPRDRATAEALRDDLINALNTPLGR